MLMIRYSARWRYIAGSVTYGEEHMANSSVDVDMAIRHSCYTLAIDTRRHYIFNTATFRLRRQVEGLRHHLRYAVDSAITRALPASSSH